MKNPRRRNSTEENDNLHPHLHFLVTDGGVDDEGGNTPNLISHPFFSILGIVGDIA
jgi:hypothetical protein